MDNTTRTVKEWAALAGINPDSARTRATRTLRRTVGQTSVLTPDEWRTVYPDTSGKAAPVVPVKNKSVRKPKPLEVQESPAAPTGQREKKQGAWRRRLLYLLMFIPAAASIQNMHTVTLDISGHLWASVCLTGLFSAAPFMFVLAGVKNRVTAILVGCMVIYEAFCNLTRIYGGLTGFGKGGFPTRFLGLVTDIFGSGTHQTGIFLAAIMAALAAATFYAAYFEIIKK